MESEQESVFNLITSLCEKFTLDPKQVKKLRAKSYAIVLKKVIPSTTKCFKDLEAAPTPFCNLLSWGFILSNTFNLKDVAVELQEYAEYLEEVYKKENNLEAFNSILTFLLNLKNIPKQTESVDISNLPNIEDRDFNSLFRMPDSLICEAMKYSDDSFYFKAKKTKMKRVSHEILPKPTCSCTDLSTKVSCRTLKSLETLKDECLDFEDSEKSLDNIWDIAAHAKYNNRRNWENYGFPEPEKEPPFLSELGDLTSLWVDNLPSIYFSKKHRDGVVIKPDIKTRKEFVRDLKYLLAGLASDCFTVNESGEFILIPDTRLASLTEVVLQKFCEDFIFSGSCYKGLNKLSTLDPNKNKFECDGYIFAEFCDAVKRYLQFYRTAVFAIPDDTGLLEFDDKTSGIRKHLQILASICKVGPFSDDQEALHGVALLNNLYNTILSTVDHDTLLVLLAVLYPCCQVYFSRFIQPWIFEGNMCDPYGEFFVKPKVKYMSDRTRQYWKRAFLIREDVLPSFITDLQQDILNCGRSMNLLRLCHPNSQLCKYLMGHKPVIISCCLNSDQLFAIEHNSHAYYVEVRKECGPFLSFDHILLQDKDYDVQYLKMIAKKRFATLRRIELERLKKAEEDRLKKEESKLSLKEEYDMALQQKQLYVLDEIRKKIEQVDTDLATERLRDELIQEEARNMIEYYDKLFKIADERREKIENHLKVLRNLHLDPSPYDRMPLVPDYRQNSSDNLKKNDTDEELPSETSSILSVVTISSNKETKESDRDSQDFESCIDLSINSEVSLDAINANLEYTKSTDVFNSPSELSTKAADDNDNFRQFRENFALARKIKQKVLNQELGFTTEVEPHPRILTNKLERMENLTDAQKNKLRVLSSEFGIAVKPREPINRPATAMEINRFRNMSTNECFLGTYKEEKVDNAAYLNENVSHIKEEPKKILSLDLLLKNPSLTKPNDLTPMSVDSTPMSDPPATIDSHSLLNDDATPTTAQTEESGFNFDGGAPESVLPRLPHKFSKRVSAKDAENIDRNAVPMYLRESIKLPLFLHRKLVDSELLKYFVNDLGFLRHLRCLRDFFFLQDGEFGRNITENLFEKLYDVDFPIDLINCRTLEFLISGALNVTIKNDDADNLSFRINSLPEVFHLRDPDVLKCLSLTYEVSWPLNILLPSEAISKYDEVFKFLLKLCRVSWALKKIFLDLRILAKRLGRKTVYLMGSPQYQRLHQCRYVMMHFMETLQTYIVREAFQNGWAVFEKSLDNVQNIDDLYDAHAFYLKNVVFTCLLNHNSAPMQKILDKIFSIILKFYDYIRSRNWHCEDGYFVHPNFEKLDDICVNFEEYAAYFFRNGRKVVKSGYQPSLLQLLDNLDINGYYSNKIS